MVMMMVVEEDGVLGSVFPVAEFSFSTVLLNNERLPPPLARPTDRPSNRHAVSSQFCIDDRRTKVVEWSYLFGVDGGDIVSNEESMTSRPGIRTTIIR